MRRLVHFLMTGEDSTRDAPLLFRPAADPGAPAIETPTSGRAASSSATVITPPTTRARKSTAATRRWRSVWRTCVVTNRHDRLRSVRGNEPVLDRQHGLFQISDVSFMPAIPGLEHASYEEQLAVRNASLFGVSDFYPRNLVDLGHPAVEFSINNRSLQTAWAREHGLSFTAAGAPRLVLRRGILPWLVRDQSAWMEQVLAAQIEEFRPDVVLTHSLSDLRPAFWRRMRNHYRLLVGQIASPLSTDIDLTPFDLMLSSLPNFVERFRQAGLRAELFRLAFDPVVLGKAATTRSKRRDGVDDRRFLRRQPFAASCGPAGMVGRGLPPGAGPGLGPGSRLPAGRLRHSQGVSRGRLGNRHV